MGPDPTSAQLKASQVEYSVSERPMSARDRPERGGHRPHGHGRRLKGEIGCSVAVQRRVIPPFGRTAEQKRSRLLLHDNEPTYNRWVPSSSVPASSATEDTCTGHDFLGSQKTRDGSPSCSAGGGTPLSYCAEFALPVLTSNGA